MKDLFINVVFRDTNAVQYYDSYDEDFLKEIEQNEKGVIPSKIKMYVPFSRAKIALHPAKHH